MLDPVLDPRVCCDVRLLAGQLNSEVIVQRGYRQTARGVANLTNGMRYDKFSYCGATIARSRSIISAAKFL